MEEADLVSLSGTHVRCSRSALALILCCSFLNFHVVSGDASSDPDMPTILWWTDNLFPHFGVGETIISCGRGSCRSSKRRARKDEPSTRGIFFYGSDFQEAEVPLPRLPHHQWALLHEESPLNNFLFSHGPGIALFNYTATFRRESDYPLATQFIRDLDYLTERQPVDLLDKNRLREQGLAPLVYVQSHCSVPSDRDRYVKELSRHIAVDSYGTCLHNKELPENINGTDKFEDEKFLDFLAQYKFHLAFENALCPDYMTEKLFRAFHVGSVPVYRGSSRVLDFAPANPSLILVDDFDSPHALAEFISDLDSDDQRYQNYLRFKGTGGIQNDYLRKQVLSRDWGRGDEDRDFVRGFECFFCDALLKRDQNKMTPKWANSSHMGCPQPHPALGDERTLPSNDEWLQQSWAESFWYAYDLARALQTMILRGEKDSSSIHDYTLAMKYQH